MVLQKVKENPGKFALGSAGSVIAIVTALFTLDARYAHAADVEKDKRQTQQIIQETSLTLRKQMIEDKLFELDVKKAQTKNLKLAPIDQAMKDRYQRQLDEIVVKKER
jgi:hypothetical protein